MELFLRIQGGFQGRTLVPMMHAVVNHGGFQRQLRNKTFTCFSCLGILWGSLGISSWVIIRFHH